MPTVMCKTLLSSAKMWTRVVIYQITQGQAFRRK